MRTMIPGILCILFLAFSPPGTPASPPPGGSPDDRCELGVTLALTGDVAGAEAAFLSLLAESPGDARAFANLANLHVLRGELDDALLFYDRAAAIDTSDAGILLNRATTLHLMGDEDEARRVAARAVGMAGGPAAAAALVGLRIDAKAEPADKAAEGARLSREEVRDLIAGTMLPPDVGKDASSDSLATAPPGEKEKRRSRLWHSSAPRASGDGDLRYVLYWKQ